MNNYGYTPIRDLLPNTSKTEYRTTNNDRVYDFLEKTYVKNVPATNSRVGMTRPNVDTRSAIKVTNWSIRLK